MLRLFACAVLGWESAHAGAAPPTVAEELEPSPEPPVEEPPAGGPEAGPEAGGAAGLLSGLAGDDDWAGGFLCPCHGSTFDLAGRVFKNKPAPDNLPVPPYKFLSDSVVLIGEDSKA